MGRVLGVGFIVLVMAIVVSGQAQKTVWDGVYTEEQAKRGADVYAEKCAMCHGDSLGGVESAPRVDGPAFYANWEGESLNALVRADSHVDAAGQSGLAVARAERRHRRAHAERSAGIRRAARRSKGRRGR